MRCTGTLGDAERREERRKTGARASVSIMGGDLLNPAEILSSSLAARLTQAQVGESGKTTAEQKAEHHSMLVALMNEEARIDSALARLRRERESGGIRAAELREVIELNPSVTSMVARLKEKRADERRDALRRMAKLAFWKERLGTHVKSHTVWWNVVFGTMRSQ